MVRVYREAGRIEVDLNLPEPAIKAEAAEGENAEGPVEEETKGLLVSINLIDRWSCNEGS